MSNNQKCSSIFKYTGKSSQKLFIIAGPCVIESQNLCLKIAARLASLSAKYEIDIIFKSSFDKANRTSRNSFRGPGPEQGLKILETVSLDSGLPILTDIHDPNQAISIAQVADVIQIPAFLCRQTDLLTSAASTGKIVNIKKGQFVAPQDMGFSIEKAGPNCWLTERGTFFGYNRLVVDFAGLPVLKSFNVPVIFDATHSVQMPSAGNGVSSGNRDLAVPLAKAAIMMGVDGLFFEIHPDPDLALCDGPNSISVDEFEKQLPKLIDLYNYRKSN
ncbi:MAG: 3-deoxy-8-phosphooctulonate synthase [Fibrobacter sp.]|nr:3-deoxy-8-phosphooctulonate synthase [Fibrobacter sp.]